MFKFHLLRSSRDILGHLILILLPIVLISFFHFIGQAFANYTIALTIGFALTFQIYGSAISVETIANDFLTPMHDRILSTIASPRKMIISILTTSTIVSFLQTVVIFVFSILILDVKIPTLPLILLFMLISVIFNQLFGTILLLTAKNIKTASSVTTVYGIIAPMIVGLYFPLPKGKIVEFIQRYSTPMAQFQTASFNLMAKNYFTALLNITPTIILIVIFIILLNPLTKRVTQ